MRFSELEVVAALACQGEIVEGAFAALVDGKDVLHGKIVGSRTTSGYGSIHTSRERAPEPSFSADWRRGVESFDGQGFDAELRHEVGQRNPTDLRQGEEIFHPLRL